MIHMMTNFLYFTVCMLHMGNTYGRLREEVTHP